MNNGFNKHFYDCNDDGRNCLRVAEVLKKTFKLNTQYMPITSVVIGIFIGLVLWPLSEYPVYVMLMAGFIAGLTASGTFDLLKAVKKEGVQ